MKGELGDQTLVNQVGATRPTFVPGMPDQLSHAGIIGFGDVGRRGDGGAAWVGMVDGEQLPTVIFYVQKIGDLFGRLHEEPHRAMQGIGYRIDYLAVTIPTSDQTTGFFGNAPDHILQHLLPVSGLDHQRLATIHAYTVSKAVPHTTTSTTNGSTIARRQVWPSVSEATKLVSAYAGPSKAKPKVIGDRGR